MRFEKTIVVVVLGLLSAVMASPQGRRGTAEATIGGERVTIDYGRPTLRGRDMLSKAPVGTVWRTGADAATMLTTETDLSSGGETIPAGSYTLFTKRVDEKTWHLVVNTQTGQWGTNYDPTLDLTEIPLTWEQGSANVDRFTIELSDTGALQMLWGPHVLTAQFRAQ